MTGPRHYSLAGLVEFILPDATIRLSEGGYITFDGEKFRAKDPEWGALGELEPIEESVGDEAPGLGMTFLPVSAAAAAAFGAPANQLAPVRFWLVEYDRSTSDADTETAELVADALLDTVGLRGGLNSRSLALGLVSAADHLMTVNEGNVLSDAFHQSVWPGELGLANAIDVGVMVAWRVKSPPRGSIGGPDGGGGGGGGGGRYQPREAV